MTNVLTVLAVLGAAGWGAWWLHPNPARAQRRHDRERAYHRQVEEMLADG